MNRINPFHNQNIIQNLGKSHSNSDKETLVELRQVSRSFYNILNKPYFDLLQIKISVDMVIDKLICTFPSGSERQLKFEDWSPIIAQRIRVLEFTVDKWNSDYCDINPSSTQNWTIYNFLLNQMFPHITTLKLLNLPEALDSIKLLKFIQQFGNLKNTSFQLAKKMFLDDFKSVLSTLKSSGIIVELRLNYYGMEAIETNILAPEKGIKSVINQLGFDHPELKDKRRLQQFANLITENQSIISDVKVWIYAGDFFQVDNYEKILKHLRVISPFVSFFGLGWMECDFFNSIYWPNLTTLELYKYKKQLPNLSINCPKLETLIVHSQEDIEFFSNSGATQQQDLEYIFRGCAKSLKKLRIRSMRGQESGLQIAHNNYLHKYLQNLLPDTKVEVEA